MSEMKELLEELREHEDTVQSQVYIEDGYIVINVSDEYDIELSRCDTNDKILGWVMHLCEKTWVTNDVIRRFIHLAQSHHDLALVHP